jgi:hypothetical protein
LETLQSDFHLPSRLHEQVVKFMARITIIRE